jgi:hypothetical protein
MYTNHKVLISDTLYNMLRVTCMQTRAFNNIKLLELITAAYLMTQALA